MYRLKDAIIGDIHTGGKVDRQRRKLYLLRRSQAWVPEKWLFWHYFAMFYISYIFISIYVHIFTCIVTIARQSIYPVWTLWLSEAKPRLNRHKMSLHFPAGFGK